jgi:hypothetical protein
VERWVESLEEQFEPIMMTPTLEDEPREIKSVRSIKTNAPSQGHETQLDDLDKYTEGGFQIINF